MDEGSIIFSLKKLQVPAHIDVSFSYCVCKTDRDIYLPNRSVLEIMILILKINKLSYLTHLKL